MSWSGYMVREGFKWYGLDQLSVINLPSEEREAVQHRIEMCSGPEEMWQIVNDCISKSDFGR